MTKYLPSNGVALSSRDFTNARLAVEDPFPLRDLSLVNASSTSARVSGSLNRACSFFVPSNSSATSPRSPCRR